MSTEHQNPPANEDINALADMARSLGLVRGTPPSQVDGDAGALVERARELGLVRKAPVATEAAKPATAATPAPAADPFGRAASKPPEGFVEVQAPAGTRTEPGAPRTRHYRAVGDLVMRHRADGRVMRRPDPTA